MLAMAAASATSASTAQAVVHAVPDGSVPAVLLHLGTIYDASSGNIGRMRLADA